MFKISLVLQDVALLGRNSHDLGVGAGLSHWESFHVPALTWCFKWFILPSWKRVNIIALNGSENAGTIKLSIYHRNHADKPADQWGVPSWPRTQRPGFGVTGGYCLLQWLGSCGVTGGNGSSLRLPTAHEEYLPAPRAQGRWQQVAHHRYRKATETCDLWCLGDGVTFLLKRMNWITVHTHIYILIFSSYLCRYVYSRG